MEIRDSVELVAGVPVMVVTPALVEIAKANGLPARFAGVAAMVIAAVLLVVAATAHPRAEYMLGKSLYRLGMYHSALAMFKRILARGESDRFFATSLEWLFFIAHKTTNQTVVLDELARFAGVAAMVIAAVLLVVAEIALEGVPSMEALPVSVARWIIGGVVYGMAAAGLYSQGRQMSERRAA